MSMLLIREKTFGQDALMPSRMLKMIGNSSVKKGVLPIRTSGVAECPRQAGFALPESAIPPGFVEIPGCKKHELLSLTQRRGRGASSASIDLHRCAKASGLAVADAITARGPHEGLGLSCGAMVGRGPK